MGLWVQFPAPRKQNKVKQTEAGNGLPPLPSVVKKCNREGVPETEPEGQESGYVLCLKGYRPGTIRGLTV